MIKITTMKTILIAITLMLGLGMVSCSESDEPTAAEEWEILKKKEDKERAEFQECKDRSAKLHDQMMRAIALGEDGKDLVEEIKKDQEENQKRMDNIGK